MNAMNLEIRTKALVESRQQDKYCSGTNVWDVGEVRTGRSRDT